MAIEVQGTRFFWSTSTAQSSAQQIGEVVDFNGPGGTSPVINITVTTSTAAEKMIGIRDEGQLGITLNYNPTDAGHLALIADRASRTKRKALIKFPDTATSIVVFKGFCTQYGIAGAQNDKVIANAVIEITGGVTNTTG